MAGPNFATFFYLLSIPGSSNFTIFLFRSFTSTTTVAQESRVTASTYDADVDVDVISLNN